MGIERLPVQISASIPVMMRYPRTKPHKDEPLVIFTVIPSHPAYNIFLLHVLYDMVWYASTLLISSSSSSSSLVSQSFEHELLLLYTVARCYSRCMYRIVSYLTYHFFCSLFRVLALQYTFVNNWTFFAIIVDESNSFLFFRTRTRTRERVILLSLLWLQILHYYFVINWSSSFSSSHLISFRGCWCCCCCCSLATHMLPNRYVVWWYHPSCCCIC